MSSGFLLGSTVSYLAAMLLTAYPNEIRATGLTNGILKALAFIGRALRFEI
jgi:hypothetical protein